MKTFKESNSAIAAYFFGPSGKERKLTVQKFIEFQQRLQVGKIVFSELNWF